MKKIILLLAVSLFVSCSSESSENDTKANPNNPEENAIDKELPTLSKKLKSYTLTSFPSGNTTTHNFDGNKGINAIKDSKERFKFIYNSNQNLEKYTSFNLPSGNIDYECNFKYDNNSKITAIDIFRPTPLFTFNPKRYTMSFKYEENKITINYPFSDFEEHEILITLNNLELITSYIKNSVFTNLNGATEPTRELQYKEVFEYDKSKNCIKTIYTKKQSDKEFTLTYKYEYDTKLNPLYSFNAKNYLQLFLIYSEFGSTFQSGLSSGRIRTFGTNMHIKTIFPDSFLTSQKFTYKNEYNDDGTLIKNIVFKNNGETSVETTFKY